MVPGGTADVIAYRAGAYLYASVRNATAAGRWEQRAWPPVQLTVSGAAPRRSCAGNRGAAVQPPAAAGRHQAGQA